MIERRTVLIVGAGASKPYGFPTGTELKNEILGINMRRTIEIANLKKHDANYSPIWRYIFDTCGERTVESFLSSLSRSGRNSVDAFIERRPEFTDIGKLLISYQLIQYENEELLYRDGGNWYQYLYDKLDASFEDFPKNNLSIITYNYDRSLEHYLLMCLKNDYGVSEKTAADALRSLNIIHLHGTLGELPAFSKTNSRKYEPRITQESLRVSSMNIKIIHEDIVDDQQFKKAKELILEAEIIWFLGFGYGRINMERLELPLILKKSQRVFGTTYTLKPGEIKTIRGLLGGYLKEQTTDMGGTLDTLNYLRNYAHYLK
ncbi:MAG: hypothetical protein A3J42_05595 [Candidatus Dadabacteria bacterium RIFCSPHIGHO2_12_FULL_53_21]|nr:MAG: hypothetical protein A3J42_05595 [Candidatus Dadabacteria bacterium RIFCSPHIGHO2_12_FULL_53_21]